MKETTTKKSQGERPKPSAKRTAEEEAARQEAIRFQRNLFFVMAVNMSWQLAFVVIIPIVGGYYLDQYFHTFPGLLIAGLLLAGLGMTLVMIRTLNEANRRTGGKK